MRSAAQTLQLIHDVLDQLPPTVASALSPHDRARADAAAAHRGITVDQMLSDDDRLARAERATYRRLDLLSRRARRARPTRSNSLGQP